MKIKQIINQHDENHLNEKTLKESIADKIAELDYRMDNVRLLEDEDRQLEFKFDRDVLQSVADSCRFLRSGFTDKVCEKMESTGLNLKSDKEDGEPLPERLALTKKIEKDYLKLFGRAQGNQRN